MMRAALLLVISLLSVAGLRANPQFVRMAEVYPGQLRYASAEVQSKIDRIIYRGYVLWDEEAQSPTLQYDGGRSALGDDWILPVVKGPFGYVLIDGHHSYLAAAALGSTTVLVDAVADFSDLDGAEFWDALEAHGWAYLIGIDGDRHYPPRDFSDLVDDPNRYLAALTVRRVCEEYNPGASRGAEYPIWIKVGEDQPFIEFRIADALWARGLVYDYSMGDQPPLELVESARQILREASIDGLWVVPQRTHYRQLDESFASRG